MPRVPVTVGGEQRDRWHDFVEDDPRFANVSDMIRQLVEREIATTDEDGEAGDVETEFDALIDRVDDISSELETVNRNISAVRGDMLHEMRAEDMVDEVIEEILDINHLIEDRVLEESELGPDGRRM